MLPPGRYRTIRGNQALAYGLVAAAERSEPAAVPGVLPDHPGVRHPARAVRAQALRRPHLPGRGRDRRGRRGPRRLLRRQPRRHHHLRPGRRAQGRDHRPGRRPGAAADRRGRAARRTVHRAAHQDRAGRPAAGDVRPQRRGAGPGGRRPVGVGLFRRWRWRRPGSRPTYRTPVFLLSDGYLANGSEPWLIPKRRFAARPAGAVRHRTNHVVPTKDGEPAKSDFWPYLRDPVTLARPWAIPGTPGLEHRIGGIEKKDGSGEISYDPANHDHMVRTRAAKIAGIEVPPLEVDDPTGDAEILVLGWGSTYGPITGAVRMLRADGVRGRPGAPAVPEPDAGQHRGGAAVLPPGGRAGDEPGSAGPADPRHVPGRRRSASTRSAACRSGSTNWSAPSAASSTAPPSGRAIGSAGRMGTVHDVADHRSRRSGSTEPGASPIDEPDLVRPRRYTAGTNGASR